MTHSRPPTFYETLARTWRALLLLPALLMIGAIMAGYEADLSGTLPNALRVGPDGAVTLIFSSPAPSHLFTEIKIADWSDKLDDTSQPQHRAGTLAARANAAGLVALGATFLFAFVVVAVIGVLISMIGFQCIGLDQVFEWDVLARYLALAGALAILLCGYVFPHVLLGWTGIDHWGAFVATVVDLPIGSLSATADAVDAVLPKLPPSHLQTIQLAATSVLVLTAVVSALGLVCPLAYTRGLPDRLRPPNIASLKSPKAIQQRIKEATDLLQRRLANLQRILHLGSAVCFFGLVWLVAMTSIPGSLTETIASPKDALPAAIGELSTAVTFFWVTVYFASILGTLVPAVVWIEISIRELYRADGTARSKASTFPQWLADNKIDIGSFNFFGIKEGAAILAPFVPILFAKLGSALPLLTG